MVEPLTQLVKILLEADSNLTWHEIADAFWLAQHLPFDVKKSEGKYDPNNSTNNVSTLNNGSTDEDSDKKPPSSSSTDDKSNNQGAIEGPSNSIGTNLYPAQGTQETDPSPTSWGEIPADIIHIAGGQALPNQRKIERALRPFNRRIGSRESELDEEATVQLNAELRRLNQSSLIPIMQSTPNERWLEVALVVDNSSSMVIWQDTARELGQLLARQGFRDVKMWHLASESSIPLISPFGKRNPVISPEVFHDLPNINDRQLILVLTDCVGCIWQNDGTSRLLASWLDKTSVTLLQVWPEHLWPRTALGYLYTLVRRKVQPTNSIKATLEIKQHDQWFDFPDFENASTEQTKKTKKKYFLPVVPLEPDELSKWARMITGQASDWLPGLEIQIPESFDSPKSSDSNVPSIQINDEADDNKQITQRKITQRDINRFRATVSPLTQKLAGLLASVPLTLPIIRLVQNALLPKSGLFHLSEFLTSGLIYRENSKENRNTATSEIFFDFHLGARDLLRRTVSIPDTLDVLEKVGEFITKNQEVRGKEFAALAYNSAGTDSLILTDHTLPFASLHLQAEVYESLGPVYRPYAQRLRRELKQREQTEKKPFCPIFDPFVEPFEGGTGIRFTVRNLKLNGGGNTLTLEQGGKVEATLEINHDCAECGGAINQIIVGLAEEERAQACVWIGESSSDGWLTVSFSLNIPAKPGVYYIRTRYAQAYNAEDSLHWWTIDRPNGPTEESNIGAVGVKGVEATPEYLYQLYQVETQEDEPGAWMFGARSNQENIATINIRSDDGGETLTGTVTYSSGEGSVEFSATSVGMSNYIVEKRQGGEAELWVIGGREDKNVINLDVESNDSGQTLHGTLIYKDEGPIDFEGTRISHSEVQDLKTAFFRVTGEICPVCSTLVTFQEAMANKDLLSKKLDRSDIAKLADGGSMDGPGYRSKIRANDDRSFGHALCRTLDLTANPGSTDTPPLLTFEFDVVEFVEEADSLQTFEFETVTVDARGEEIERKPRRASFFEETLREGVPPLAMVAIPGDSFSMGSPENEKGRAPSEGPQHPVNVPEFFMAKYPVTQAQWKFVAGLPQVERSLNPDPSQYEGDNHPVEQISWFDAVEFCDRLSRHTGKNYRLPSEAEWEYACRAGTTTPFHFGETITSTLANYNASSTYQNEPKGENRQGTTPVGSFGVANHFGLFDMHGNVWEWCADHEHINYDGAPNDGSAWITDITGNSSGRSLRGGSWATEPESCRSARRNSYLTHGSRYNTRLDTIGIRVVCSVPKT